VGREKEEKEKRGMRREREGIRVVQRERKIKEENEIRWDMWREVSG
jgi:hypothetical protein